ncbi:hypothetical protein NicSoilB8_10210 [Arthrobacter sp. NicSoilB8]|nr:hypothetical protein NicSoilB8_10210 [Arthrobacter sp. NicSoilB8]
MTAGGRLIVARLRLMARRRVAGPVVVPLEADPYLIVQQSFDSPRGKVRAWFKGGVCYRARIAGTTSGGGEGPAIWAAVLDGSFRPDDFGKHNR